ncbi:NUDIX pyrophosphatase [Listeria welshimeri]|uniref:NUDIX hydrolase n=1 Tax=Listeria welshimeri TaxID=1643 RepID=UPI00188886C9|nr:NUDIX pyrophosphatase [Listeria welshimeri]MBF2356422.1 NUDIX pyrophosphatase [Listeria welshimeri]
MRQPFQILVIPFIKNKDKYRFGVLLRKEEEVWQFVAGGGEENETIVATARRESAEELNLDKRFQMYQLDSLAHIPGYHFSFKRPYVIPEYSFAIDLSVCLSDVKLSLEHKEFKWVSYEEAFKLLAWDSNKTALYELNERLKKHDMNVIEKG